MQFVPVSQQKHRLVTRKPGARRFSPRCCAPRVFSRKELKNPWDTWDSGTKADFTNKIGTGGVPNLSQWPQKDWDNMPTKEFLAQLGVPVDGERPVPMTPADLESENVPGPEPTAEQSLTATCDGTPNPEMVEAPPACPPRLEEYAASLLVLGRRLQWEQLELGPGVTLLDGKDAWRRFCAYPSHWIPRAVRAAARQYASRRLASFTAEGWADCRVEEDLLPPGVICLLCGGQSAANLWALCTDCAWDLYRVVHPDWSAQKPEAVSA